MLINKKSNTKLSSSLITKIFKSSIDIQWNGKKPKGGKLLPTIKGKTAAEYVLEDRR